MKKGQSLNDLFALTREHPPAQELVSAENLLNHTATSAELSTGTTFSTTAVKKLSTLKAGALALTTSMVIAGLWFASSGKDTTSKANQKAVQSTVLSVSPTTELPTTEASTPTSAVEEVTTNTEQTPYFTSVANTANAGHKEYLDSPVQNSTTPTPTQEAEEHLPIPSLYAIHDLSVEEIKRLGISLSKTHIEIRTNDRDLSPTTLPAGVIAELSRLGYDTLQNTITTHSAAYIKTTSPPSGGVRLVSPGTPIAELIPVTLVGVNRTDTKQGMVTVRPQELPQETMAMLEEEDIFSYVTGEKPANDFPFHNRLVAIHIRFLSENNAFKDIYVWYEPTKELLAQLPELHRTNIHEILSPVVASVEGTKKETSAFRSLKIEAVQPNPAQNNSRIRYSLEASCNVSLNLYSTSGSLVRTIIEDKEFAAGPHEMLIDLQELRSGTYLLEIRTSNGEQATQKIVVQK